MHYVNTAFLNFSVEGFLRKKYTLLHQSYTLINIESFLEKAINPNVSVKKDVFKIDYPYSKSFWKNQNQLVLTKELKAFLKRIEKPKKDYKSVRNFEKEHHKE